MQCKFKWLCTFCVLVNFCYSQDGMSACPDTILIASLENIFEPVLFKHGEHAQMVQMKNGCPTCHHYAEDDDYVPCGDCHLGDPDEASWEEPTINGAYHRNCMSCHREWVNDHVCETCHVQKRFSCNKRKNLDRTDPYSVKHPSIKSPESFIYRLADEARTVVTFHHEQHVNLYRIQCASCHRSENCRHCHSSEYAQGLTDIPPQITHENCVACHDTEVEGQCGKCHQQQVSPGFEHGLTGWPLKQYHQQVQCQACHPGASKIQRIERSCNYCHAGWDADEFDHASTGLGLSEDHLELDCYDCHVDSEFNQEPECADCHDDEFYYPHHLPGSRISLK